MACSPPRSNRPALPHGSPTRCADTPMPPSSTPPPFRPRRATAPRRWTPLAARSFRSPCPPPAAATGLRLRRGLSPADLAMHVVLPEVDGRIFAGVASFKSPGRRDPDLQFARFAHRADPDRIAAVVARVTAWASLATTPTSQPPDRHNPVHLSRPRLSDGPCRRSRCHRLDRGTAGRPGPSGLRLPTHPNPRPRPAIPYPKLVAGGLPRRPCHICPKPCRPICKPHGANPTTDPLCQNDAFHFPATLHGTTLIALQPERGRHDQRERRIPRPVRHPAPCLCRLLPVAARPPDPRTGPHGRPWHAGMAARQIRRPVRRLLARGADRPDARDLPLHRHRPRRGGPGQTPHRCRHPRPPAAAAGRPSALPESLRPPRNTCSTNTPPPTASTPPAAPA